MLNGITKAKIEFCPVPYSTHKSKFSVACRTNMKYKIWIFSKTEVLCGFGIDQYFSKNHGEKH